MAADNTKPVSKLPCPLAVLTGKSSLKRPSTNTPETLGHLQGYRSRFNIHEMKQSYHQQNHDAQNQQQQHNQYNPSQNYQQGNYQQANYQQGNYQQQNAQEMGYQQPNNHRQSPQYQNRQPNQQKNQRPGQQRNAGVSPHGKPNGRFQQNGNASAFWCEKCERGFRTQDFLENHVEEHEKCFFEGCKYEAHTTLVQKHIETQHNTGLFQKIGTVETEEDIEKWREERRKRYPTKTNIELRQKAQEERLKRGERLEKSKKRFGDVADRRPATQDMNQMKPDGQSKANQTQSNVKNTKKRHRKRQNKKKNEANGNSAGKVLGKADKEKASEEIGSFSGIARAEEATDVELPEVGPETAKPEAVKTNALFALSMYASDSDSEASENEDQVNTSNQTKPLPEVIQDQVHAEDEKIHEPNSDLVASTSTEPPPATVSQVEPENSISPAIPCPEVRPDMIPPDTFESPMANDDSDDGGPEEQSIKYVVPEGEVTYPAERKSETHKPNLKRPGPSTDETVAPAAKKGSGFSLLDMSKRYRKQNTLLEKLLEKDIRHERNVLLQCVRYVVENSFFDGRKDESETTAI